MTVSSHKQGWVRKESENGIDGTLTTSTRHLTDNGVTRVCIMARQQKKEGTVGDCGSEDRQKTMVIR
jgi:hypothetical protein